MANSPVSSELKTLRQRSPWGNGSHTRGRADMWCTHIERLDVCISDYWSVRSSYICTRSHALLTGSHTIFIVMDRPIKRLVQGKNNPAIFHISPWCLEKCSHLLKGFGVVFVCVFQISLPHMCLSVFSRMCECFDHNGCAAVVKFCDCSWIIYCCKKRCLN